MTLEEVLGREDARPVERVLVDVVVGEVLPREASSVLRLLAETLPLDRFGLSHLVLS